MDRDNSDAKDPVFVVDGDGFSIYYLTEECRIVSRVVVETGGRASQN